LNRHYVSVIDDEADLAFLFKQALSQIKGIVVLAFTNPAEALEHFMTNQQDYEVVVSDYRMPTMTGLEVLTKMKEVNQAVRRILISAFEIQDEIRGCNCVDKFLQKPIAMEDLINEVERLIKKSKF